MLVRESLPDNLPRIDKSKIADPVKFWATYAVSFYERLFFPIESKKKLKKAYSRKFREMSNNSEAVEALNFFYRIRRDELDGINLWESMLFESPDGIEAGNLSDVRSGVNSLSLTDFQIPFGYYDGKMRVGKLNGIHPSIKELYQDIPKAKNTRKEFEYPGRIWIKDKIVSFWEYPKNKTELIKILSDVENEFFKMAKRPITINPNDWYIEIVDKRLEGDNFPEFYGEWADAEDALLIPISEYEGSDEWSEEKKGKSHVQSPMKKLKKEIPYGFGSKNPKTKSLALKQAMYAESYYPSFKEFLK